MTRHSRAFNMHGCALPLFNSFSTASAMPQLL
jgi:hypothetical protein